MCLGNQSKFYHRAYSAFAHRLILHTTLILVLLFECLITVSLANDVETTAQYSIEHIVQALKAREKKASSVALEFSISRSDAKKKHLVKGVIATHQGRFLFRSSRYSKSPEDGTTNNATRRFAFACDGTNFFGLRGNVKRKVMVNDTHTGYLSRTANLAAQPLQFLVSDRFKEPRLMQLFEPEEVLSIKSDSYSGDVIVEINGTKRSDYARIVYKLSPSKDWALVGASYQSGGKTVARAQAYNFFKAPGTGLSVAGRWKYERLIVDEDVTHVPKYVEATFEPLKDFNLENPANFVVNFPPDAVDPAPIRGMKADIEKVIDGSIDDFMRVSNHISTKDSFSQPHKTKTHPVSRKSNHEDRTVTNRDSRDIQTKDDTSIEIQENLSRIRLLSILLVSALAASITFALIRMKTHQHTLIFGKSFTTAIVGLITIMIIFLCVRSINIKRSDVLHNEMVTRENRSPYIEPFSETASTNILRSWLKTIDKRLYIGRFNDNPLVKKKWTTYRGYLTRNGTMEVHQWNEGPGIKKTMMIELDRSRMFVNNSDKAIAEDWGPTAYSIITAYEAKTGKLVPLKGLSKETTIDISELNFINIAKQPIESALLKVDAVDRNTISLSLILDDKLALTANIDILDTEQKITEQHRYFNKKEKLVWEWEFTYSLKPE